MKNDSQAYFSFSFLCFLMSVILVWSYHGVKWKLNEHVHTAARFSEHSSQKGRGIHGRVRQIQGEMLIGRKTGKKELVRSETTRSGSDFLFIN